MAELDNEFKQFLASYKYYPDLTDDFRYNSLPEDKRDALIALAKSEYGDKFEKWKKVPSEIIWAHPEGVPQWILDVTNEADSARLLVLKENTDIRTREELEEKVKEVEERNRQEQSLTESQREARDRENYAKEREAFEKIVTAAAVLAVVKPIIEAGYTPQTAENLAKERLFRDDLFKKYGFGEHGTKLSEEKRGILRQSRLKTFDLIKEEWEKRRPERALIHELSRFNRGKISEAQTAERVKELVTLIRDNDRFDELDRYLRHPLVRAKIRQFNPEKIEMLTAVDRVLFDEKHAQSGKSREKQQTKDFDERDLPEDVRTVLGKVKAVHEKTSERQHLFNQPRVRLRVNSKQNTQS